MFDLTQVLDFFGLLNCTLIILLLVFKSSDKKEAILSLAFFTVLGLLFATSLPAAMLETSTASWYAGGSWLAQSYILPLSYLLIIQVMTGRLPERYHYGVLAIPVLGAVLAFFPAFGGVGCEGPGLCPQIITQLQGHGVIGGTIILFIVWLHRHKLARMFQQKGTYEHIWLVLTLIVFNILNVSANLPWLEEGFGIEKVSMVRSVLALTFAYIVMTMMFRVQPKPVFILPLTKETPLRDEEQALAGRIRDLMTLDKLYQEASFSRADLARELSVSESVISRVINRAFEKTFPQLLNGYRVSEAEHLLCESKLAITQIAYDVGFNSLASFNRVFRDSAGCSATEYRTANMAADEGMKANAPGT